MLTLMDFLAKAHIEILQNHENRHVQMLSKSILRKLNQYNNKPILQV